MKKLLIVVDMQNDFVDGALGSADAIAIVDSVVKKIEDFDGDIIATLDTHFEDYMDSAEGKKLPVPHCIKGTEGHRLNEKVMAALEKKGYTPIEKLTFGSVDLPRLIRESYGEDVSIELCGLCTDICVVSNALILKASFTDAPICVDRTCCAGVTPESHEAALTTMASCQIDIIG